MTKTSPSAITRHPRQTGSGRPFPSRSCASPTSMPSTAIVRPFLQTVCPGQRQHALKHGDSDRQVAIEIKERSKKIGRLYGDKLGNAQPCRRLNAIEADRNAV
jgi:hypothetical protein